MSINIESIITVAPALIWTGVVVVFIYIVISDDDDNLSTP